MFENYDKVFGLSPRDSCWCTSLI